MRTLKIISLLFAFATMAWFGYLLHRSRDIEPQSLSEESRPEVVEVNVAKESHLFRLPPGTSLVTLPINLSSGVAGFVVPGSKVDVLATSRGDDKILAVPILVNVLVLAVDEDLHTEKCFYHREGRVSFAVSRKQKLLINLAQDRKCEISLLLRSPDIENEGSYNIDEVIKLLQNLK